MIKALSPEEALGVMSPAIDIVLLDLRFSEEDDANQSGLNLLDKLKSEYPQLPVVITTGYGDVNIAVDAMRRGAADFIPKLDLKVFELQTRLERAMNTSLLERKVEELEKELKLVEPRQIVGTSPSIINIKRIVDAVARDGHVSVLIRGETGTGKELLAHAIHASGWRRSAPFVPVMLSSLPQSMLEAELFGHEVGAFTDAKEKRIGYFEKARGGVLFLDEIGEIGTDMQIKLLRFVEEHELQRLGSTNKIKLDLQIIAATNANLEEKVSSGSFREDLYFRLKVHEIVLPPLRERQQDIVPLISYILEIFRKQGKRVYEISGEALEYLKAYSFPGNVRQLKNIIESALFYTELHGHSQIAVSDLPPEVTTFVAKSSGIVLNDLTNSGQTLEEILDITELRYIEKALQESNGSKSEAGRLLGYNDRFAFSRRVKRIFARNEPLRQAFSELYESFAGRPKDTI